MQERLRNGKVDLTHERHSRFDIRSEGKRAPRAARLDREQKEPCDLYFIESQCQEKFIKIGIASNIFERLSKLQVSSPYELKLLKLVKDAAHLEREIHREFSSSRVRGEWFRRSPELLELIESFPSLPEPPKIDPREMFDPMLRFGLELEHKDHAQ